MAKGATGVYRTRTDASGAEYAVVDYGTGGRLESITRQLYEDNGYEPDYESLPTQEEYEKKKG